MITCSNCGTPQFLQITKSRIYFEDGSMLHEISEQYQCTLCNGVGRYTYDEARDNTVVTGDVELTTARPKEA
ncbi:MAG: hypothetical protein U5K37_03420 [Natrialbaceae archaeon]|nr:hypothetical protein [Natrialbaceae archaeon]